MNKLLFILLCCIYTSYLGAQSVNCDGRSLNVTDVVCTDGFMTFVVSAQNGGSNHIDGLPDEFIVNSSGLGNLLFPSMNAVTFENQGGDGLFYFNVPSPGCVPLNLPLYMEGGQSGCNFNLLIGNPLAPIPTLSQWMIIMLAFMVTIFGVIGIRSSLNRKVEV